MIVTQQPLYLQHTALTSVAERGDMQQAALPFKHARTHPFKHVTRQAGWLAGWLVFGGVVCAVGLWLCFRSARVDNDTLRTHFIAERWEFRRNGSKTNCPNAAGPVRVGGCR